MQAQATNEQDTYEMMRPDLDKSLIRNHIEPSNLSSFQRILLTTDGTLTEILEAYLFEPIRVVKLSEELVTASRDIPDLEIMIGSEIIERKILLQGKISRKNIIYAESVILLERLEPKFKDDLLNSQIPIGRLWLEHKLEIFKEIIDSFKETAQQLSDYFQITNEAQMLCRTYRVFSRGKPIMMITEKFPESYFLKSC